MGKQEGGGEVKKIVGAVLIRLKNFGLPRVLNTIIIVSFYFSLSLKKSYNDTS
jgi:hypothetical protein